jgi:hypothetical protein
MEMAKLREVVDGAVKVGAAVSGVAETVLAMVLAKQEHGGVRFDMLTSSC